MAAPCWLQVVVSALWRKSGGVWIKLRVWNSRKKTTLPPRNSVLIIKDRKLRREFCANNFKQTDLVKIILVFLLPAGYADYKKWHVHKNFPSGIPDSILNRVFLYFQISSQIFVVFWVIQSNGAPVCMAICPFCSLFLKVQPYRQHLYFFHAMLLLQSSYNVINTYKQYNLASAWHELDTQYTLVKWVKLSTLTAISKWSVDSIQNNPLTSFYSLIFIFISICHLPSHLVQIYLDRDLAFAYISGSIYGISAAWNATEPHPCHSAWWKIHPSSKCHTEYFKHLNEALPVHSS